MSSYANLDVRMAISESGLYAYQVAERLGIAETSFSRLLRKELSADRKAQIIRAIGGEGNAEATEAE